MEPPVTVRSATIRTGGLIVRAGHVPASAQRPRAERTEADGSALDDPRNPEGDPPAVGSKARDAHPAAAESEREHQRAHGRGTAEGKHAEAPVPLRLERFLDEVVTG